MGETGHAITHFMAVGAERRLEDYHFLRNTYETVTGQEVQLNRILRMMGEDEYHLNWRLDLSPVGRGRFRSPYEFDRWGNNSALKGSIAYERLRDLEQSTFRHTREPSAPVSSRRVQEIRERRQRLSEQREYGPSSASGSSSVPPSAARLRALAEYDAAMAESDKRRQQQVDEIGTRAAKERDTLDRSRDEPRVQRSYGGDAEPTENVKDRYKSRPNDEEKGADSVRRPLTKSDRARTSDVELSSFTVRREIVSSGKNASDETSVRLSCSWTSPNSSADIDYYTVECQTNGEPWSPVGDKIDRSASRAQLDISPSNNTNAPSYFRLKAHLQNGQTFTSKPSSGIYLLDSPTKKIVVPDIEVLSPSSVQLTWNENEASESEAKSDAYDVEKKEEKQVDWEKVSEVPLSQRSARIDSLTDAAQCQFRLVPAASEPANETQAGTSDDALANNDGESDLLTVNNVNEWLGSLNVAAISPTTVQVDIAEEGFRACESYKVEYTTANQPDQWKQLSDITHDNPHLSIDKLKQGTEYKFRFTPVTSAGKGDTSSSQLSLILDVKTPPARRGRFAQEETETPAAVTAPPSPYGEVFTERSTTDAAESTVENHADDSDQRKASMAASSRGSFQKDTDDQERKPSVATSSRGSFQKDADDNERKPSLAASSKHSLQHDVEEEDKPADEDESTDANQHETSSQAEMDEDEAPAATAPSARPHFKMQKLDSTSVLIEAVVPEEEPATFDDVYEVYSKKETSDEDWTKVGTIDKEHLSTTVEDLEEDTAYAIKIDNATSPSPDEEASTIQQFKFVTTPVKQYDPSLFLEKIEESLENVVNGVMEAAAGHQIVEEPVNKSLNEVIKEVFRDESLVPSEKFGFETLALNTDLQIYRGPKQMMLKELEVDETVDSSKHYGEIIIHNHRTSHQSVAVREENGNTRVANIDGDVIIRNVVSDVILKNEQTHHQLSMNIVGQAFLKGVQGTLIASKFRGIIVVKNVNKP